MGTIVYQATHGVDEELLGRDSLAAKEVTFKVTSSLNTRGPQPLPNRAGLDGTWRPDDTLGGSDRTKTLAGCTQRPASSFLSVTLAGPP